MKSSNTKNIIVAMFTGLLFSTAAMANSGVIRFHGAIIDGECDTRFVAKGVEIKCNRDNKLSIATYNLNALAKKGVTQPELENVNLVYLNKEKTLANLNIDYK